MFNRVERYRKRCIKKATPITREQCLKLTRVLAEIGLPYSVFFDYGDGPVDNKVICLSNDTFIVKDCFEDFKLPGELVNSID